MKTVFALLVAFLLVFPCFGAIQCATNITAYTLGDTNSFPGTNHSFTMCMWMKLDTDGTTAGRDVFSRWIPAIGMWVRITTPADPIRGIHFLYNRNSTFTAIRTASNAVPIYEWFHIAARYDSSVSGAWGGGLTTNAMTLWTNGIKCTSRTQLSDGSVRAIDDSMSAFGLPGGSTYTLQLPFSYDECFFTTNALTDGQVYDLYRLTKHMKYMPRQILGIELSMYNLCDFNPYGRVSPGRSVIDLTGKNRRYYVPNSNHFGIGSFRTYP